jgi:hypothetical protein
MASKSLPARPSLESLRKQSKKIARDRSVSLRDAQLVLAREYGFAGWQDLTAEVSTRLGKGLEWAVAQAEQAIHDNDVERVKQLLAEHPALLSWQDDENQKSLLGFATGAYGDAGDAQREEWFTRGACAELLIDAGAVVTPSVVNGLLDSRARGLLELFQRKGLLPRTLKFVAALGRHDDVRAALEENDHDLTTVNEAFVCACRFAHAAVASLLLERSIELDPELGKHVDGHTDRVSFVESFSKSDRSDFGQVAELGLWKVFVMGQVSRAAHDDEVTTFVSTMQRERWLLAEAHAEFQAGLIGAATLNDRGDIITALLSLDPALLRRHTSPEFHPIALAITYAKTHLIPLLTRIWPLPKDLPHAAGMGDLARVKRWFDESGAPALGDLEKHFPCNDPHTLKHDDLHWGTPIAQHVLDTALAWAVINRHFDVADFLLEHGADINTNWNSHEPASILHTLVFMPAPYESMQFLIDRGIDMTIKDYRWDAAAIGWARYGKRDEQMAQWLEEAERKRQSDRHW